ncbi:hypothetical protein M8818_003619 [Zalaria obscura]|uniref:Uncharacterized protein n=1 Tax=Zalaria obscura TaxID=2024903 RepID=A0ACC3SEI1_9PEZI
MEGVSNIDNGAKQAESQGPFNTSVEPPNSDIPPTAPDLEADESQAGSQYGDGPTPDSNPGSYYDDVDRDSALGSLASSTTSVRSSLLESVEYHTERDRLDLQHHLFRMTVEGKLHLAPLDPSKLHNALDLATGTGIWAIDFGKAPLALQHALRLHPPPRLPQLLQRLPPRPPARLRLPRPRRLPRTPRRDPAHEIRRHASDLLLIVQMDVTSDGSVAEIRTAVGPHAALRYMAAGDRLRGRAGKGVLLADEPVAEGPAAQEAESVVPGGPDGGAGGDHDEAVYGVSGVE